MIPFRYMTRQFWEWYERHKTFHIILAAALFVWQLAHLVWLTTDVVAFRLFGDKLLDLSPFARTLVIIADYTEIPALISVSLLYLNELRKRIQLRNTLFFVFTNVQWLHLFWITDAFILRSFTAGDGISSLPFWLVWIAIVFDYFELPVMFDVLQKFLSTATRKK